jgi:hypothetical protein
MNSGANAPGHSPLVSWSVDIRLSSELLGAEELLGQRHRHRIPAHRLEHRLDRLTHRELPRIACARNRPACFGSQMPSVMVPVQNALELPDTGVGLSVVMFFRLMGGAFGVALLTNGAIVGDLNAGALLLPGHDVLGPHPGIALLHLDQQESANPALLAGLQHIVRSAFSRVYLRAAAISALTLITSFGLKEIPLRAA